MKKKFFGLILATSLCVACAACAGEKNTNDNNTPTEASTTPGITESASGQAGVTEAPESNEPASNSVSDGMITVTISTDKSVYAAGEQIQYSIKVENGRELYVISSAELEYKNTNGLEAVTEESAPTVLPQLLFGETYELRGTLIGNAEVFPAEQQDTTVPESGADFDPYGGTRSSAKVSVIETDETVTVRPYVEVTYGGQQVMVRAVLNMKLGMEKGKFSISEYEGTKRVTCHDPSIFKDFDGTYYIFGTHMALSYSSDLKDWTSMDARYQSTFTKEVQEQIRAWNKDSGAWYSYLWAPDVIYNEAMGKYCMYLSADGDDWKSNIVLLTADAVTGPYEYAGSIVYSGFDETNWTETDADEVLGETTLPQRYITNGVKNKKWGDEYPNCIDPTVFYDDDGKLWMAYGSWSGGIFILELDEQTGLRDYNVTYETNAHSDAYFGTKIAGGKYVSGEAAYIEKIGDYYWLFISYGYLDSVGGYNMRVYRSTRPDGDYVDALGNDAYSDKYVLNHNLVNKGVRIMGGYQWRTFSVGELAQGHNSAFVNDDGRAYVIYHTRTNDGSEGHTVRVHQLFLNKEGWLVTAPYQTVNEKLDASVCTVDNVAGKYEVILHKMEIDYANREVVTPECIYLNADGTVTGYYEGSWSLEEGTSYINVTLNGVTYSGVALEMKVENLTRKTMVFTALGKENQLTLWGSKIAE